MKKALLIILTLAFFMTAMFGVVVAGESRVFSDQQVAEFKKIIQTAYHSKTVKIYMEPYWNGELVSCYTSYPSEYICVFIYMRGDVRIYRIGSKEAYGTAEKIKEQIEAVLNRPASEELGRNLLK